MKVCPVCGVEFEAKHPQTIYCSKACRNKAKYITQTMGGLNYKNDTATREPMTECFAYRVTECDIMKPGHFPCKFGDCTFYKHKDEFKEVEDELSSNRG